jgi:cytochrome c peroxidase
MMRIRLIAGLVSLVLLWTLAACSPGQETTEQTSKETSVTTFALPDDPADGDGYAPIKRFEAMGIPTDNPLILAKAKLGRQLYYDHRLSGDGSRSCYSCHVVEHGLTDGLPTAIGAYEKKLTRSSPTMWNIGYHSEFYWDGRANSLEKQAKAAWTGGNMGAKNVDSVIAVINGIEGYRTQFQQVFGGEATVASIPMALATYMRTIISDDTPWDRWQKGDSSAVDASAKRGYEVFKKAECASCHSGVLLTDQQFHNVGIGMDVEDYDVGRFKVTELEQSRGAFKTPTLRDIAKSAPYFHNGSVGTLEEAVRLMVSGGGKNPYLDEKLKPRDLSDTEIAELMAFLESLSQESSLGEKPNLPE